jgi:RNA 2',3'-cyclic 3'-phosphodiesterase
MQALRCFVAVPVTIEATEALARLRDDLRLRVPEGVRWERDGNFHLTLKFLGDVEVDRIQRVSEVVERAAKSAMPTHVRPESVDAFPHVARPRVLVLRFREDDDSLSTAVHSLEAGFQELGSPREARAFTPHLTLGRVKREARLGDLGPVLHEMHVGDVPAIPIDSLVLYQSELGPKGSTYTPLCEYPLVGLAGHS